MDAPGGGGRHAASRLIAVALVCVWTRSPAGPPRHRRPRRLHHRCPHRHVDPAAAWPTRAIISPLTWHSGWRSVRRLWRRLGLRAHRHSQAGDRGEPGHRRAAAPHRPRGVGRQRAGWDLLLGGRERQVGGGCSRPASKLHMWFTQGRPRAFGFREARIATSNDDGRTWRKASWAFTRLERMLMPSFLQVGKARPRAEPARGHHGFSSTAITAGWW